ncbi:MAG: hypothetical protein GY679_01750 [Mycoplasma sp.]|nr:hypothetical protein [Mycoplasma sp.]
MTKESLKEIEEARRVAESRLSALKNMVDGIERTVTKNTRLLEELADNNKQIDSIIGCLEQTIKESAKKRGL